MQIAFDLDDTITRCPRFFAVVSKALIAAGHKVYIITFREDRAFAEEDLAGHNIAFDELLLPGEEELRRTPPGDWKTAAAEWKAGLCRRLKIDLLFDDMPEVTNAIDGDTAVFMAVDPKRGKVGYMGST